MQQEQDTAAGEKFEVISKFLQDTEAYLHRLAEKVASVKLSQEASEAATRATAEARAQVPQTLNPKPARKLGGGEPKPSVNSYPNSSCSMLRGAVMKLP